MTEAQKLIADFIPRLEEMVRKEQEHLDKMKGLRWLVWNKRLVDDIILNSEQHLAHYQLRLQQYREYIQ